MPVAIFNYLFAQYYDNRPEEVASLVLVSTAIALVLLPLLVYVALALQVGLAHGIAIPTRFGDVEPRFVLLLAVYSVGILWVLGLLYVTLMKFAGVVRIDRPGWLFGSIHRSMAAVLLSAAALVAFDTLIRVAGVL